MFDVPSVTSLIRTALFIYNIPFGVVGAFGLFELLIRVIRAHGSAIRPVSPALRDIPVPGRFVGKIGQAGAHVAMRRGFGYTAH